MARNVIILSNQDGKYNFPFGLKILWFQTIIFFLIWCGMVFQIIPILIYVPCKPEDRFEPCDFKNKTAVEEILSLKHQSINSSELKDNYEYQKIYRTKCYIKNMEHEKFMLKVILYPIQIIYLGLGLISVPALFIYFINSTSVEQSNEEKELRKKCFSDTLKLLALYFVIAIILICIHLFFTGFERDNLENLPLFVVEKTENFCKKHRH